MLGSGKVRDRLFSGARILDTAYRFLGRAGSIPQKSSLDDLSVISAKNRVTPCLGCRTCAACLGASRHEICFFEKMHHWHLA